MKTYGKLCTLIYDLDKPYAVNEETAVYTACIQSKKDKILEPMCGSGRFYIPLLKAGYNITGFDLSIEMLNACKAKCAQLNIVPDVFQADIVQFQCEEQFQYVFIPIGSISLITDEKDLIQSFANIYNCLNKKGIFIFSFFNIDSRTEEITDWKETMRYTTYDKIIVCKQKLHFDEDLNILDIKLLYELIENGKIIETEYQDFPIKLFNENYLKNILYNIGFKDIGSLTSSNPKNNSIVYKCIKE